MAGWRECSSSPPPARARVGDPRRTPAGAVRWRLPRDLHGRHRRRLGRHLHRDVARRTVGRPARTACLLPVALSLGGAAAIAAVPIIRALGPSADGARPSTIVVLAALAFFVPSALLSAVTPLVVKLQLRTVEHTGRVVGRLSRWGPSERSSACSAPGSSSSPSSRRLPWCSASGARSCCPASACGGQRQAAAPSARRSPPERSSPCSPPARQRSLATPATSRRRTSAPACDTTRSGRQAGCSCSTTSATPTSTSTTRRTSTSPTYSCSATSSTRSMDQANASTRSTSAAAGSRCRGTWRRRGRAPTTWCSSSIRASSRSQRTNSACSSTHDCGCAPVTRDATFRAAGGIGRSRHR